MRFLCTVFFSAALTILLPCSSIAQDRGSVDLVSGFNLSQPSALTGTFFSTMNLRGRVAFNVVPGFQAVGEVGRIGNVLPALTTTVLGFSPYQVRASAIYAEGGLRTFAAPRSSVSPYVEATTGIAHLNVAIGGLSATTSDLINLGLAFTNRTSPVAGIGGGVMFRTGPMSFDIGYRYKKIFAKDLVASLLGAGQSLHSQQLAFGVGARL